ncbi:NAD(P)H-binding protein [Streptomyces sp. ST2-7A]|uniref:NmrA family NAD(P)-binding protein n=1 Tax=Streptomyces sp. ST2-7A TaxID=2907214 RepID=UPI001F470644|nr:NAD(P)H-binding protein [Streptomyces sp. ST2-7A]MCE7083098.1 NmrA family transcriptional regulator [Streptomyces sp. ST2-7A]
MTHRTERPAGPPASSAPHPVPASSPGGPAPTLVIGGTGKTGRRVANRLAARDLPVRIGSRSGEPPFDWGKPETWEAVLEGTGAVYITYYPDLGFTGAAEAVGAFSRLAVARGIRRLVLLSGRGEEGALRAERELRESGAEWTVVRAGWFFQNFDEGFFLESVLAGELALPTADAVEPFVDVDDIADVVVEVLISDGHVGRIHELSGPRALDFREVAAELSEATGREIRYTPVPLESYRAVLVEHGLPAEFADLFRLLLDGRNAQPVDGVREVLGRAPRDFSRYARETAATGVWNPTVS